MILKSLNQFHSQNASKTRLYNLLISIEVLYKKGLYGQCYELIQKAALAGIPVIAGLGAPSTMAVDAAREAGLTLIGFLRSNRFNVHTGAWRLIE